MYAIGRHAQPSRYNTALVASNRFVLPVGAVTLDDMAMSAQVRQRKPQYSDISHYISSILLFFYCSK